ncbi:MAG: S8 family serine peptidase, partial [Actinomycetota bacterium]|nr:S8 family serine peptidase [Actinomycetota bacterium]
MGTVGRKASRALLVGVIALAGLPATSAAPAAAAEPRPVPDPVEVSISTGGFVPAVVTLAVGQSVEFTNDSGAPQTVTATDGAFDSGTIPPGGGFTMAIGVTGTFSFASANTAAFTGMVMVGLLDLPGTPGALVSATIPLIAIPPIADMDQHPAGIYASRSRALVMFKDGATVADANDALADAGVTIVATIPSLNAAVVQVLPIPATGDFAPLTSALATVRAHPAVAAATMDKLTEPSSATMPADSAAPTAWAWDDGRGTTGSAPVGTGDNWGLESARVPSTWNLLDGVRTKSPNVQTVIYDHGFEPTHPDLKLPVVDICRGWIVACTGNPSGGDNRDHGTHVAGTIGATFDNAGAQPGTTLGVSGVNPVAKMAAVSWKGNFVHFALGTIDDSYAQGSNTSANWAAWTEIIDQKKPDGSFPNLRAVNMSGTTMVLVRNPTTNVALWGANNTLKRCGPGLSDDAGGTGPCTPNTLDGLLAEVANDGVFARRIAERASSKDILLSIAAANDSNSVCADSVQTASPANGACPAGFTFVLVDTRLWHAFGWANANWQSTAANPILMVEAVDITNARAGFSNIGGDVSAPGVNIWSTFPPGRPSPIPGYNSLGGTSMAAPHVTGLAGWLAAYKPSLSVGQIKAAIVAGARSDTTGGAKPRIDAYSSFLIVGALADLADVNDPSADGNRRIIRSRTQTETVDTNVGTTVGGAQLHSAPDGKVDMRDFRRFRDALLQTCSNRISVPGCPPVGTETMDGANNHPKNDLNYDGCVFPTACRTEEAWSRFDLNGDGMVTPNRAAPVPLGSGGADVSLSDMEMFARVFQEPSEGWNRNDLAMLLRSGDLEVHADTMFQAGATGVTIEVRYGASGSLAPGPYKIDRRGGSVIVTVPTVDAGTPVEIIGRATVDGKPLVSALKKRTLKHGEDARIDVCVPVINVTTGDPTLYADGKDKTKVHGTFVRCDGDTVEAEHMSFKLETEETAPLATLSAPTAETNESGRATVEIAASTEAETVTVLAEITIVGSATTPPQVIRGKKEIPITNPPRMIYKWEQVTSDWNVHGEANMSAGPGGGTIHRVIDQTSIGPVTIGRTGHLTPYDGTGPGSGNDRASVRVSEVAGPSAVDYASVITETPGGTTTRTSRLVIPTSSDEIRNELLSPHILDFSEPSGRTRDVWELPNTFMDITDGTIVVNNVSHVSALHYRYASNESVDCQAAGFGCDTMFFLDQVGLTEREEGSAFQVAPDLRAALTFTRKPDNTWSTYRWCGAPQTFDFAPRDLAAELYKQSGTATSKFRFVATITTDPDMTEADLTLPDPTSCITEQKPPVAAIARDFVTAKEGQVVKFLDASSDPNSDVDRWHWDFGDGATSDEQFPTHRFGDDGSYRVTLTVTDAANLTDRTDITVDVVNVAPTVGADDINVASGDSVELAVRLFDPGERDQEALTLKKSFGGEAGLPVYVDQTIPAGSLHINLGVLPDGHHELTLTAVDKDGASSASVTVAIDVGEGGTVEPDEDIEVEAAPGCDFGVKLDTSESDFVDLVTQYRVENSLYRVYPSPTLTQAAEDFAEWLRDNDLFQHEGPGGNSPKDRAEDAEYPGLAVGENLARGPRSAPNVMVGWQVSDPHNVNMLDGRWHAIGISKLDTPRGPLWVTVYGDVVDCPDGPPDLAESFSGASLAPRFRLSDLGETEVLGWRTAEPAAPTIPITAFTVSDTTPATGATVAVGNRSSGSALFQPGDGQLPYTVAAGATAGAVYLDPGTFSMSMMLGSRVARIAVDVGGVGRTVEITPLGPPGAAFGARPTVRAMVATAGGEPVANRTVEFTISGQSTAGVTDATGTAAASLLVDFLPGLHTLTITVPALPGGTDVSTTTPFTVTPNALPVATLNGPYDVLIGSGLAPDLSGSFDPDGVPLANVTYDLNGDGIFGDFFGFGLIPADVVREQICGGTCTPGVDKTIRARVIDVAGGQAEASALVRFTRDFLLSITPGTATVNPGGSISFQVGVITTSGFAQPVALTAPDLPVGVTATFSPAIVTPTGTSILTLTAALSAPSFDT